MREEPPKDLIQLLERLQLASAGQVRAMARRVRRLARELPPLESVWVDALAQARLLTPFQAAEINAGRGTALRVGPYLLCGPIGPPNYVDNYLAREPSGGSTVRLALAPYRPDRLPDLPKRLENLVAASRGLEAETLAPVRAAGIDAERVWAASDHHPGVAAADWMAHNGRFPPEVALEIARQMAAALELVHKAGLCHGDVSAAGLILGQSGRILLPQPGLRGAIRPEEGYAQADLPPEAYDYLSPERILEGTPPNLRSDIYACGCVWWHLLTGRAPIAGGDSLSKLKGASRARIADVRELAPETPPALAEAIAACVRPEAAARPESFDRLAAMLGPATAGGKSALARRVGRRSALREEMIRHVENWRKAAWPLAGAACVLIFLLVGWRGRDTQGPDPAASAASPAGSAFEPASPGIGGPAGPRVTTDRPPRVVRPPDESLPPQGDLVLASSGPRPVGSLSLRAGQVVRGGPGKRPAILVPPEGLRVRPENVRFENIDFVWQKPAAARASESRQSPGAIDAEGAILCVEASRAEFHGCSFRSEGGGNQLPAAIRWSHPAAQGRTELALPAGQLRLSHCVFHEGVTGIACRTAGAISLELVNTLHLSSGPLVWLDHVPGADEPVRIGLKGVTLRSSGPVLECSCPEGKDRPGMIAIEAERSVLVTARQSPLVRFVGPGSPERLLGNLRWTGQGSLISPDGVIAQWRPREGETQTLDESAASIAGLVRSEVQFAGPAGDNPSSSQVVRWHAPLSSPNPPGIDAGIVSPEFDNSCP